MSTAAHVIVGAGPVGCALACRLADAGERVRVVTRSGRGPDNPGVERIAVDASDADSLAAVTTGAQVLYNCANPGSYAEWERAWPPLAAALLAAAARSGAVLATMSNLYGYGPVDGPMRDDTPLRPTDHKGALRARMWEDARAAHEAGRVRATEVRASDFLGPTVPVGNSLLAMYARRTLARRPATVFADPDQPHTWTAIDDVAATLVAAGASPRAWGAAWIVPSAPARSVRQALADLSTAADADAPRLRVLPRVALATGALVVPVLRELRGVLYQFERPFVADGSHTTAQLGVTPTAWSQTIGATAPAWRDRSAP